MQRGAAQRSTAHAQHKQHKQHNHASASARQRSKVLRGGVEYRARLRASGAAARDLLQLQNGAR
eukprot:3623006-Alexandrium_andersonii.AAC.1